MRKLTKTGKYIAVALGFSLILLLSVTALFVRENQLSSRTETNISHLQTSLLQLQDEQEALTSQNAALSSDNAALSSRAEELSAQLEEKEAANQALEEENLKLTEQLLDARAQSELFVYQGLVRALDIDGSLSMDLRYATKDNFTHQRVYPADAPALLTLDTALKLKKANERFEKDGFRIRVWDAYRPKSVQEIFWNLVPDPRYVADPSKGSVHNRGASVDVTLEDLQGNELEMPTEFDDFSEKASPSYQGSSAKARENMLYLRRIMEESGFTGVSTEWWHFDDKSRTYPLLDVDFSVFQ